MKVIDYKNLPVRMPIGSIIISWLICDKFNYNGILVGILGTINVLLLFSFVFNIFTQDRVDIFNKDKE